MRAVAAALAGGMVASMVIGPGGVPGAAADFWRLWPHYWPQISDSACSLASAAMVLGALGAPGMDQAALGVADAGWGQATAPGGEGVSFAELVAHLRAGLDRAGLAQVRLGVVQPRDGGADDLARLRAMLAAAAGGAGDVVLVSFDQGRLWGEASVGHVSPVGDYDAATGAVLIMDVDPAHFGPHWWPDSQLLAAMAPLGSDDPDGAVLVARPH